MGEEEEGWNMGGAGMWEGCRRGADVGGVKEGDVGGVEEGWECGRGEGVGMQEG